MGIPTFKTIIQVQNDGAHEYGIVIDILRVAQ